MISGLDVSIYQATTPSLVGQDFLIVKAMEGSLHDPMFATHIANGGKAGVLLAAYAYGVNGSGSQQAHDLIAIVGNKTSGIAIDVEGNNPPTTQQIIDFISTGKGAGYNTGYYHSLSGYRPNLGQDWNWIAYWNPSPPAIPWDIWQNGSLHGVDHDYYKGTRAELATLWGATVVGLTLETVRRVTGNVVVKHDGLNHSAIRVSDARYLAAAAGTTKEAYLEVKIVPPLPGGQPGADRASAYLIGIDHAVLLKSDVDDSGITTVGPPTDCTPLIAAAVTADRAKARIVYA